MHRLSQDDMISAEEIMKKKTLLIVGIAMVAVLLASCAAGSSRTIPVPKAMVGSWYDDTTSSTLNITSDNIVMHISNVSTVPDYNFKSMVEAAPQAYKVSGNDSSISIEVAETTGSGYYFTISGDILTVRISTLGMSTTLTFTKR